MPPPRQNPTTFARVPADRRRWLICGLLLLASTINYLDRQVLAILSATAEFAAITGFGPVEYGYASAVFQAGLRPGPAAFGPARGSHRHAPRVHAGHGVLEPRRPGPRLCPRTDRLFRRPLRAGPGRGGQLPHRHQGHRRALPPARAGLRHRDLQRRHQPGGPGRAPADPLDLPPPRLAGRLRAHRPGRLHLDARLVAGGPPGIPARQRRRRRPRRLARRPLLAEILGRRNTWAVAVAKLLTDPIWFFYLAWLPGFFASRHGIRIDTIGCRWRPST